MDRALFIAPSRYRVSRAAPAPECLFHVTILISHNSFSWLVKLFNSDSEARRDSAMSVVKCRPSAGVGAALIPRRSAAIIGADARSRPGPQEESFGPRSAGGI